DPVALSSGLGGTPDAGGTWTGPDGLPHGPTLDPSTDVSGTYTYTVTGVPPCVSVSATVQVQVNTTPDAGIGGPVALCSTDGSIPLISLLQGTPQTGGTW